MLQLSRDPILRRVYSELVAPHLASMPATEEAGYTRLCRGDFAYMAEYTETMAADLPCRVAAVPQAFFPTVISMAIHQDSPYKSIFSF